MRKPALFFFHFLSFFCLAQSELKKNKNSQWYFAWGYTHAAYSLSDIHLQNNRVQSTDSKAHQEYDFTLYKAKAHDRPDMNHLADIRNITIPQFVCHLGYSFNEKWGLELNYDHTKYIVEDYQRVHIKGQIDQVWMDKDTILDPESFIHFEHSDGANFLMLNAVRRWKLFEAGPKFRLSWVLKAGGGIVIPRTDVTLFGEHLNNDWKVAGCIFGIESGLRTEFLKYGFFEFVGKGACANYINSLVLGKGNGKASHHFYSLQMTASIGFVFGS